MQINVGKVLLIADTLDVFTLRVANTELHIDIRYGSEDVQLIYRNTMARNPSSICFGFTISNAQYCEPDFVNHRRRLMVEDRGNAITCRSKDYSARRLTEICIGPDVIKGAFKSDRGFTAFRLYLYHDHVTVGMKQKFRNIHRTTRLLTTLKNRVKS